MSDIFPVIDWWYSLLISVTLSYGPSARYINGAFFRHIKIEYFRREPNKATAREFLFTAKYVLREEKNMNIRRLSLSFSRRKLQQSILGVSDKWSFLHVGFLRDIVRKSFSYATYESRVFCACYFDPGKWPKMFLAYKGSFSICPPIVFHPCRLLLYDVDKTNIGNSFVFGSKNGLVGNIFANNNEIETAIIESRFMPNLWQVINYYYFFLFTFSYSIKRYNSVLYV